MTLSGQLGPSVVDGLSDAGQSGDWVVRHGYVLLLAALARAGKSAHGNMEEAVMMFLQEDRVLIRRAALELAEHCPCEGLEGEILVCLSNAELANAAMKVLLAHSETLEAAKIVPKVVKYVLQENLGGSDCLSVAESYLRKALKLDEGAQVSGKMVEKVSAAMDAAAKKRLQVFVSSKAEALNGKNH